MKSLNKNEMVMVRMNRDQYKRLMARARAEAVRRNERLPASTLARELIERGLDQMEQQATAPAVAGSPA
jgi:predicted DNA-binding protein